MENGLLTRLTGWIKRPFSGDMDAVHWFLFFGLIMCIAFLWSRVLYYINKGLEV